MDDLTARVRAFYTEYPYPSTASHLRADSFLTLLASYVEAPPRGGRLRVLDAGCGTGAGLIPVAALHPHAEVIAVDLSPTAVAAALGAARARGLGNVQVWEADLLAPEVQARLSEATQGGGFDVIYASGVLHHLADPAAGLRALAELLAPSGVLSLMLYGRYGRAPVERAAAALQRLLPSGLGEDAARLRAPEARSQALAQRLARARAMLASLEGRSPTLSGGWAGGSEVADAEFADRYLHEHAVSFTVEGCFAWLRAAGLRFLRWMEPRAWSLAALGSSPAWAEAWEALDEVSRYAVIEQLLDRPRLECFAVRADATARRVPSGAELLDAVVEWNPQAALILEERRLDGRAWLERVEVRLRALPPRHRDGGAGAIAQRCAGPILGAQLTALAAHDAGVSLEASLAALQALVEAEVLYLPHGAG